VQFSKLRPIKKDTQRAIKVAGQPRHLALTADPANLRFQSRRTRFIVMATTETMLTAEEYLQLPDYGCPSELVRGRIVAMNVPSFHHGLICNRLGRLIGNYAEDHHIGYVLNNDAGVITERDPDTVRGPDVSFYSYSRVPKGTIPAGYPDVVPEVAIEVRSPTDGWPKVLAKVSELLTSGVDLVYVVDAQSQSVFGYTASHPQSVLSGDEEMSFPSPLEGLRIPVKRLFEL
jgi:Uma2 family endonuclease